MDKRETFFYFPAHLSQSGGPLADLSLAQRCYLLHQVAIVGQCPRQPGKLCPSCLETR